MSIKQKYERIKYYEKPLNEIIKVIEIIDPIRNDSETNNYINRYGVEMITIPRFKSWLIRTKNALFLKVHRQGGYEPITLELTKEIIDSLSISLCEKRDWYKTKIDEIDNDC